MNAIFAAAERKRRPMTNAKHSLTLLKGSHTNAKQICISLEKSEAKSREVLRLFVDRDSAIHSDKRAGYI